MSKSAKFVCILVCLLLSSSLFFVAPSKASTTPAWDFEDHTYTHTSMTTQSTDEIISNITTMNSLFRQYGLPTPIALAYPNGDYDQTVENIIEPYRLIGRTAGGGPVPEPYPVPDWHALSSANIEADTTFATVQAWIDTAVQDTGLLNLFTHRLSDPADQYSCTPSMLNQILYYLKSQQDQGNLLVLTVRDAYSLFNGSAPPQKAVVTISFDDGWDTDYTVAYPMFQEYGFAGTSYIVGDLVGYSGRLNWAMIDEMAQTYPPAWPISINSNPLTGGSTDPSGTFTVEAYSLTVKATPAAGYVFGGWTFDGKSLYDAHDSFDEGSVNPITLPGQDSSVTHNLTANFVPIASSTIFQDGFETGSFSPNWWGSSSNSTIVSSPVHSGSHAAQATGFSYWDHNLGSSYSDLFFGGYVQITQLPSSNETERDRYFLTINDASYSQTVEGGIYVDNLGGSHWLLTVRGNWFLSSIPVNVLTNHWYFIEIEYNTDSTARMWVDDTLVSSAYGQPLTNAAQRVQGGNPFSGTPAGFISYGDDYAAATEYITGPPHTLSVSTAGNGSVVKSPEKASYNCGESVTLTATPAAGWSFSGWSGALTGSTNPASLTVTGDMVVMATFTQIVYSIAVTQSAHGTISPGTASYPQGSSQDETVTPDSGYYIASITVDGNSVPVTSSSSQTVSFSDIQQAHSITATFTESEYTLTTSVVGGGSVTRDNYGPYHYGDVVQLTAVPTIGWSFSSWSGDLGGSTNPTTITIDGNKAVTATFTQNVYTLTATTVGSGTVNLNNSGPYYYGDVVELTAVPIIGWSFDHWSGYLSGSANPTALTITGDKAVTATFTQNTYTLTVATVGSGSVNLNSTGPYRYGDAVQLTAGPTVGWSFDHWSGDLTGSANPTTILINGDKTVTATFAQNIYTLTVTILGTGSVDLNNSGPYHYGDIVEVTANPAAGWSFDHWNGDLSGSVNPTTILIDDNKAVTATFTQNAYTLTVTLVGSGSVAKSPDQTSYHYGDVVQLSATPALGWSFGSWSGALTGSTNPASLTVTGDMAVTATFTQNTYTLTVTTSGSGSINLNNPGPYHYGDVVQFTAVPAIGWSFDQWSQDLTGSSNPATLTITGNMAVTAHFTENTYTLTVNVVGTGCSVSRDNNGPYHYNDVVHLTANAAAGWAFSQWSGALTGNANPAALTITGDLAVTATFAENQYTLTITVPSGGGSVSKSPDQATYTYGTIVTLTASPADGWSFSHWSGDLGGSASPAHLTIDGDKSVTATFTQNEYTLTISYAGDGSGSVSADKSAPYHYGDIVQLTATPADGSSFSGWSSDLGGSTNPQSITIDGNKAVTATFTRIVYTLTISTSGSGSVSTDKSAPYYWGDVVQLTAVPSAGWSFSSWSGDVSGSVNPVSVTIYGPTSVTATFTQNEYTLMVHTVGSGSVVKSPDQATYHYGDIVQLTATASAGYTFNAWSGDAVGSTNVVSVTIDGNKDVTATFTESEYTLTTSVVGGGSVTRDNYGPYHYGDVVQLTAVPTIGWSFSSWSGDLGGSTNPTTITIDGNKAVTATFTQNEYSLTVTVAPSSAASSVSADIPGPYHLNDVVTLTPTANPGYTFSGWTGDGVNGAGNTRVVTVSGDMAVTATFTEDQYTLTIDIVGSGSVDKSPDQATYTYGTVVTLTATADPGWTFAGWTGDLVSATNPDSITMTGSKAVTATFTQNEYALTVNTVGSGSVVKVPDQASYHYGDVVQLTATPVAGWSFSAWGGALTGSTNPADLTITGDMAVTATFIQNTYTLTVTTSGSGSVNLDNYGPYHYGDVVQLTAVPTIGWSFSSWSGDLGGSTNPTTITIDGNKTVTATFTQNEYTLTVNTVGNGVVNLDTSGPYHYGEIVQLTAVPASDWVFSYWGGDLSGSANPTTITIDGNKAVTATFTQNAYTLTVTIVGSGSVNSDNNGPYHYGDVVQLTAMSNIGWTFDHWSGDLTGSTNPATITITGNMVVTATFTQNSYAVVFTETGLPSGTQWSATLGGNTLSSITSTITFNVLSGTYSWSVTNPISGASHTRYFTATSSGTIGVTQQTSISITYVTQYQVSFTAAPGRAGTTSPSGTNVWITAGSIQISATANSGHVFDQWRTSTSSITIDNAKSATATATINGPGTITANFVTAPPPTYTVTFQESNLPSGTAWSVTLNGVTHTSTTNTITFNVAAGTYSWSALNPVAGTTGTRYVPSPSSGRITVSGATTIQIQYRTQYYLTMKVQPAGAGSTSPGSGWYNAGTTVAISASASRGHTFTSWTGTGAGSYTGTSRVSSVTMNSPITETASFA